jgi:restriction system protein
MPIPDYQSLMLPVLLATPETEVRIGDVISRLADKFNLTPEERAQLLPSGVQGLFANRVHWAKFYLSKAGLIESTRRGYFRLTPEGKKVIESRPTRIDNNFLGQFEAFEKFKQRSEQKPSDEEASELPLLHQTQTPDEVMRAAHKEIDASLAQELLECVRSAPPEFFGAFPGANLERGVSPQAQKTPRPSIRGRGVFALTLEGYQQFSG